MVEIRASVSPLSRSSSFLQMAWVYCLAVIFITGRSASLLVVCQLQCYVTVVHQSQTRRITVPHLSREDMATFNNRPRTTTDNDNHLQRGTCIKTGVFWQHVVDYCVEQNLLPYLSWEIEPPCTVLQLHCNPCSYSSMFMMLALCANDSWSARSLAFPWNHFNCHDNASAASFVLVLGMLTGGWSSIPHSHLPITSTHNLPLINSRLM